MLILLFVIGFTVHKKYIIFLSLVWVVVIAHISYTRILGMCSRKCLMPPL